GDPVGVVLEEVFDVTASGRPAVERAAEVDVVHDGLAGTGRGAELVRVVGMADNHDSGPLLRQLTRDRRVVEGLEDLGLPVGGGHGRIVSASRAGPVPAADVVVLWRSGAAARAVHRPRSGPAGDAERNANEVTGVDPV